MGVPYTFANATTSIPLSQLDSNFGTAITVGNTAVYLGNTVTTLNNMTLANVTVSSGNVTFTQGSIGGNVTINTTGTANTGALTVTGNTTTTGYFGIGTSGYISQSGAAGDVLIDNPTAGKSIKLRNTASGGTLEFDGSGNLLVGTTNASDTAGDGTKIWPNGDKPRISMVGNSTSSVEYPFMIRSSANNTWRMYVDWAGNIYAQNTAITSLSDIRLKENVRDLETGLDTVLALKPRRFDWKNGEAQNVAGFIAQEVEPVMPELVTTGIDADEAGDKYKMLAPGNLIPTLVKAIQELSAKNDALEARLAALEAK